MKVTAPKPTIAKTLAACGLTLLLAGSGCDHGSSGPTEYNVGANDPNVVVAFGDSLSSGEGSSNGKGYRPYLESMFWTDGRTGVRVVDEGRPGTLSDVGVSRINKVLARNKPAVLVLLYGTNDELFGMPQYLFNASFTGTTTGNLRQIIAAARANQTLVVLSTVPPVCGRDAQRTNIATLNEKILALGAELRAADDGVFTADVWKAFLEGSPPDGCGFINLERGNHPNDAGYAAMAQVYYTTLSDSRW